MTTIGIIGGSGLDQPEILANAKHLIVETPYGAPSSPLTCGTIEGPRFSTRAESNLFRIWGADVVNMSIAPEAALANAAGIPYAAVAMATDYDCWKTDEAPVEWPEILRIFGQNVQNVTRLLRTVIPRI